MQKVIFIALFLLYGTLSGQDIIILDADSKEPLTNAVVYNLERSKIAISSTNGTCNLESFEEGELIFISHLGYEISKTSKAKVVKRGGKVLLHLKPEELDEVVMSISRWEQQKKDIPQKIVAVDSRTAAFYNPQTTADILQQTGKVFVQKSQLGGGSPMIRGFSTNRLLIAVDGVRMNNAIFRGGNIQNIISIDPFTVKSTEIIFGPGSVVYGSDAIGGVMNFFTQKPVFSSDENLVFYGNSDYRFSSANGEQTGHIDFNFGKREWAFLTSISKSNFDDLRMGRNGPDDFLRNEYVVSRDGEDLLMENKNPRKQVPTGYNQINMMQKVSYKPNTNWNFNLGAHYSETSDFSRYDRLIRPNRNDTGLRSAEWYYGPQKWFMSNFQINKSGKGNFYDRLKIVTAYQWFEESRFERGFEDPIRYGTKEKVDAVSTNIDFENKKIGNLRLYYGGEYVFNKVNSKGEQIDIRITDSQPNASRYPDGSTWQTMAGYLNAEYKLKPNVTLLSGIRYSHVWIDAVFDKTFFPFPFDTADLSTGALTTSVGFSWFPKANLQITWNGSTGFRAPNIDDIGKIFDSEPGSVVVPNPDLESEYAYNTELGIHKNFEDKLVVKSALFYTYLVDALVRRNFLFNGQDQIEYNGELSNVQAIQNAAKAYVYGMEFGIEAFFTDNLSIASNLTITKGIEEEEDGTDSQGRHVAPTFGDFHIIWKKKKLKTDLFLNYNGEIPYRNLAISERGKNYIYASDANGNPYVPSWYTLNFSSQYQISSPLKIALGLENLTNQLYRPYSSGISAPGTNLIVGLGYKF